jgi:DNA mismatch repair protein MutL
MRPRTPRPTARIESGVGRISKLSDELANQIAAGEVVERPASVVKELVENSLDAGATRVVVDVELGGTALVRVSDDGEGMTAEDAVLALERHATSKIHELDDLFRLHTFGFRGEALPSIASVSRLVLRTRARDAQEGTEVIVEAGKTPEVKPCGGATGTTIEVRELFFNVPARRKFLKATATESAHIGDVVLGAALARPDVTFVLSRDGRVVRELLRVNERAARARGALSGETLSAIKTERGALRIEAMLGPPERARAGATGLALLVNGRHVRDRLLARAVAHAYGSVLDGGRYPVGVVWIEIPPELVDVNVHPQKAEVRFADARGVFDAITRELHAGLSRAFSIPALAANPFAQPTPTLKALAGDAQAARALLSIESYQPPTMSPASLLSEQNLFSAAALQQQQPAQQARYSLLRYVGQMRGMFLVCEGEDGLYVLDQHAAAERATFDRLRRAYEQRHLETQRLLVPEIVEIAATEVALLEENAEAVAHLGMEVRAVADNAVAVHAVPALLAKRAEPGRLVRDLAAELSKNGGRELSGAIDLVLATMACHGSVRAGDAMSREEVEALLRALDAVDFAGHCPHGRPLVMRTPWGELEKKVGR